MQRPWGKMKHPLICKIPPITVLWSLLQKAHSSMVWDRSELAFHDGAGCGKVVHSTGLRVIESSCPDGDTGMGRPGPGSCLWWQNCPWSPKVVLILWNLLKAANHLLGNHRLFKNSCWQGVPGWEGRLTDPRHSGRQARWVLMTAPEKGATLAFTLEAIKSRGHKHAQSQD